MHGLEEVHIVAVVCDIGRKAATICIDNNRTAHSFVDRTWHMCTHLRGMVYQWCYYDGYDERSAIV